MKRLIALLLLLANLTSAQSWGPMLENQNTMLSQQNAMLGTLSTDSYTTIAGNLLEVLTVGSRKGVYNTSLPLAETWIGTVVGNRLATVRIVDYPVTVTTGQTVINIPHGLPYTPIVQLSVKSPAGVGNPAYIVNTTNIVVTLPTGPLVPTPYIFNWMGR